LHVRTLFGHCAVVQTSKQAIRRELDPNTLRDAIVARLPHRSKSSGRLQLPAIPALLDHYTSLLIELFAGLGYRFSADERRELRSRLNDALAQGFAASAFSKINIRYGSATPPDTGMNYEIESAVITVEDEYEDWTRSREPPLFGAHPDAKVMSLAHALSHNAATSSVRVLDVGAGTGRNTLPLARAGFQADAAELAPSLAALLRKELQDAGLQAQVFEGDALDPSLPIPAGAYQLVVLAEVVASHFRDVEQVRKLFERAASWIAPGGLLLFSAFVATDGYEPDVLAKQASQAFWSCLFTRAELTEALRGQPFELLSDESCYAFERNHLAKQDWPPTGWFERWSRGHDLFELSGSRPPHELRWLTYRRTAEAPSQVAARVGVVVHVDAPREHVFRAALDPSQAKQYFRALLPLPGIVEREPFAAHSGGAAQPGATRKNSWTDGSATHDELIALDEPLRLAYRWQNTLQGPLSWLFRSATSDWMFVPTEKGTSIYWSYRIEPRYRLLQQPLKNIVHGAFGRWMRSSLQALKTAVEREHGANGKS
jgi:SAM-dependent methyltransferase